jgi:hypothetical protein
VSLPEVVARLLARRPRLGWADRIVAELAWREYWLHVWSRAGDAVLAHLRGPAPWPGRYATGLPADLREGGTGVPAIDAAVRTLYATGLHEGVAEPTSSAAPPTERALAACYAVDRRVFPAESLAAWLPVWIPGSEFARHLSMLHPAPCAARPARPGRPRRPGGSRFAGPSVMARASNGPPRPQAPDRAGRCTTRLSYAA